MQYIDVKLIQVSPNSFASIVCRTGAEQHNLGDSMPRQIQSEAERRIGTEGSESKKVTKDFFLIEFIFLHNSGELHFSE